MKQRARLSAAHLVVHAEEGIHVANWIPASAGMTIAFARMTDLGGIP